MKGCLDLKLFQNVDCRQWNKKNKSYRVFHKEQSYVYISRGDLINNLCLDYIDPYMDDQLDLFVEKWISLTQRAPEIAFLNKKSKGA